MVDLRAEIARAQEPLFVCVTRKGHAPSEALWAALGALPSEIRAQITLVEVDIDRDPGLMDELSVHRVPELLVFHRGDIVERTEGSMGPEEAADFVEYVVGTMISR